MVDSLIPTVRNPESSSFKYVLISITLIVLGGALLEELKLLKMVYEIEKTFSELDERFARGDMLDDGTSNKLCESVMHSFPKDECLNYGQLGKECYWQYQIWRENMLQCPVNGSHAKVAEEPQDCIDSHSNSNGTLRMGEWVWPVIREMQRKRDDLEREMPKYHPAISAAISCIASAFLSPSNLWRRCLIHPYPCV
ncbi:uncharacterized protein LOC124160284 [Ischnura elegans]|uniref:uncharacterized protein LOC124160284 n=1 Tax=Ischnura elegans TaxID=197161 RepID=UPI001ED8A5C8|nr:uncharacterized protein LOC124160284 [Ischnura elegans]